jgi:hypothetical protein
VRIRIAWVPDCQALRRGQGLRRAERSLRAASLCTGVAQRLIVRQPAQRVMRRSPLLVQGSL